MQFLRPGTLCVRTYTFKFQSTCSLFMTRSTISAKSGNIKTLQHDISLPKLVHTSNISLQKHSKTKKNDVKSIGPDMKTLIKKAAKTPEQVAEISLEQSLLGSCTGCGIKLQTLDPQALGYVPPPELRHKFGGTKAPPDDYLKKRRFEMSLNPSEIIEDLKNFRNWRQQQIANKYKDLPSKKEEEEEEEDVEVVAHETSKEADKPVNDQHESASDPLLPSETDPETDPQEQGVEQKARDITDLTEDELLDLDLEVIPFQDFSRRNRDYPHKKLVCQRCFMLKNYGRVVPVQITLEQFKKQLSPLRERKALVFKVVDIFDFQGSFVGDFDELAGDNEVVMIANKVDLLPEKATSTRIEAWLRRMSKAYGFRLKKVYLVSSRTGAGMQELIEREIDPLSPGSEVYVMGVSNTGKSSFLNKLIDIMKLSKSMKTTTSPVPGTTLNIIQVRLPQGAFIYDTPGIKSEYQVINWLTPEECKMVYPTKKVRSQVYSLKERHSILLGGLARVDYVSGPPIYFTLFVSPDIHIHTCKTHKAADLLHQHTGTLFVPPLAVSRPAPIPPQTKKEWLIEGKSFKESTADIVFAGLGWVAITGTGRLEVDSWAPEGVGMTIRDPLMPFETPSRKAGFHVPIKRHQYVAKPKRIPFWTPKGREVLKKVHKEEVRAKHAEAQKLAAEKRAKKAAEAAEAAKLVEAIPPEVLEQPQ